MHSALGNGGQFWSLLPRRAEWRRHGEEQLKWPGGWNSHLGRRGQNGWGLCFGEEDVRKLYRFTKAVDKVKAELLLTKCHGVGGVCTEGTDESSQASALFQNTISYWHHRTLRAGHGDHCSDLVGHYILCHTCIMHSRCAFIEAQPVQRHITQMKTCSHPVPASTSHPPPLTQSHLSVHSRQAGSRHPLSTDSFLQPQNCSSVTYSRSLAQQDLCLKSAGVCLSRRNKEAILHSSDKCVPPFSERKWDGGKSV